MKLRFYHIWVYKLFYYVWTPVLKTRPDIVQEMANWNNGWLAQHEAEIQKRRSQLKVVK